MLLRVKLTPNASSSEILGWENDPLVGPVLRIRLQAPPVEGAANKALLLFLAKHLGLPKSSLTLKKGDTSRLKTIQLPDGTPLPPKP
ncbi:MAG: DUF167 domain-containing protein [Verrucomicrobia bacterium]|nr:DUF167 domain-containing protein [Verrucomicrobiota bacterium]